MYKKKVIAKYRESNVDRTDKPEFYFSLYSIIFLNMHFSIDTFAYNT